MPCRDDYAECRNDEENVAKLHNLTEMLCSFCKAFDNPDDGTMPARVRQWWNQHKAEDQAREAREKAAADRERQQLLREKKRIIERLSQLRERND